MTRPVIPAARKRNARSSVSRQEQCYTKNPGTTDVREETSSDIGIQQRHKEPRFRTEATLGKQGDIISGPRTDSQVGGRKANSQDFH
jgi:hypothetical protein